MTGTLIGVGVGPGAPDLITLRAARLIGAADVIAYPTLAGSNSFARKIVADLIPDGAEEIALDIPMRVDRAPAQAAYDIGATAIADRLTDGSDVVFLCEGDPFFYGSFMYVYARLSGRFSCDIVPGVSSVMACAATTGTPLVARNETFAVLAGPMAQDDMRAEIARADSVAIMKVGRHLAKIRSVIGGLGLMDKATYVERASLPEERKMPLAQAPETAPYFSMILIVKGADPWL